MATRESDIKTGSIMFIAYLTDAIFVISSIALKKIDNESFGLNHIILLFFFLFNFGQMFMWTLGIHFDEELGKAVLYGVYSVPSVNEIYKAQVFALFCFNCLTMGMIVASMLKKEKSSAFFIDKNKEDDIRKVIYKVSCVIAVPVILLTFVKIGITLWQSAKFGYISLYYSGFSVGAPISRAEDYFFPVIVGLLIGSNYKKMKPVYIIFSFYMILYMLAGERGNWVYKLIVLIWMHHSFYKPISIKTLFKVGIIGLVVIYIVGIVVDLRQYGFLNITTAQFAKAASLNNSFLTRFIFEMGSSLSIIILVMGFGRGAFLQYGNTFFSSFIASFSSMISSQLGINHVFLANHLSQNLLHIGYGAGFNIFAEFYVNYGYYGAYLLLILGFLIGILMQGSTNLYKGGVMKSYIACICCSIICSMVRDSALGGLRQLVQVALFLYLIITAVYKLSNKRQWTVRKN